MTSLFEHLCDIFELDTVSESDILREFDFWDSLSVISLIAVLDSSYGISIEAQDLAGVLTVGDLAGFVEAHRKR